MTVACRSPFNYGKTVSSGAIAVTAESYFVSVGNFLVAVAASENGMTFSSALSGWTLVSPNVMTKVAAAGDVGTNFNFPVTAGATKPIVVLYSFTGTPIIDRVSAVSYNGSASVASSASYIFAVFSTAGTYTSGDSTWIDTNNIASWDTSNYADLRAFHGIKTSLNSGNNPGFIILIAILDNQPPNTAAWSSPADGAVLDRSVAQTLTYTATDPDPGDSQSQRKWRYSSDGGTTWIETDETTVSQSITITGGTLAAGDYQFQVMIADQSGTWAASWSPSLHLTFADAPSAPTITEPTSGGTVAATNVLQWSFSGQVQYQVRKVADDAGTADASTIYYDSGAVADANTRQVTLANDTNNRWEHQQVRCMDSTGLWSTWADSRVDVTFNPPPTATVTLTEDPTLARIVVGIATAAPGAGQVAAVSASVQARPVDTQVVEWSRSGLPINGDVEFFIPASGVDYEFAVTTIADNGATAVTDWIGSATGTADDDSPLISGGTAANPNGVLV